LAASLNKSHQQKSTGIKTNNLAKPISLPVINVTAINRVIEEANEHRRQNKSGLHKPTRSEESPES
jgi:hypothetical protein